MTSEELADYLEDYQSETIVDALAEEFSGVTNAFLGQVYCAITGRRVDVVGECAVLLACPCCSLLTLTERFGVDEGGHDICDHCHWEDDGTTDPLAYSPCNRGAMTEYRNRIVQSLSIYGVQKWHKSSSS